MSARPSHTPPWLVAAAAAVVAGGAGFGLAKLSGRPEPAPAADARAPAAAPQAITVPAASLAVMQIAVEPVAAGDLAAMIQAPGLAASEPSAQARVTAGVAGAVVRIHKRLGDPVRAGEALAELSSRDAAAMAADRRAAEARAALARTTLQRERELYAQRVTPRQDLEAAEAAAGAAEAEARRAATAAAAAHVTADGRSAAVVSPIAGRVTAENIALGGYVQPDAELFRVADPRRVQIEAAISAADAARIRPGDPARVTDAGGAVRNAAVRSVTPTLDAQTRTATALLSLAEGARPITPGEAVRVQISPRSGAPSGIVVPEDAVQSVGGRTVVFVRTPTGFRVQPVTLGARSGGRAAVLSGLQAGEAVATRNAFLLKAEASKGAGDGEE